MARFFVGIAMPQDLKYRIDAFRSSYPGRLIRHVEPHVTLVPPLDVPDEQGWLDALNPVCSACAPFCVGFDGPDSFGQRVLFVRVKDWTDMALLRAGLYDRTVALYQERDWSIKLDDRPFHPHITLAMTSFGTPAVQMESMRKAAADLCQTLDPILVSTVTVYQREAGGWRPYKSVALGCKSLRESGL